ncbi:MAG: virulence factor SrfB [Bacteroidales bacterium]|nr:virulence factor SrfB [Bacteroidales bacterium]
MASISLIYNTGIQYYEYPDDFVIDLNENVMKALRFYEFKFGDKVYLDPTYYFPIHDKYLRRMDLIGSGYLDPLTNVLMDENEINESMNWLDVDNLLTVNRLDVVIGDKRLSALEQIENRWLPMPYFVRDSSGNSSAPTNWCRIKLIPKPEKTVRSKRVYKLIMAFDTTANVEKENVAPVFQGEPFLNFSLCGVSSEDLGQMNTKDREHMQSVIIPLKAYEYCNIDKQPWLNRYLQEILNCTNPNAFEVGSKMKYLVYYAYLITYLHKLEKLPDIRLYNDVDSAPIFTNLVLDVGNSRTFGLVAEDPIDTSFSKSSIIKLRDLETGDIYAEPFDMRLCFKEEIFDIPSMDGMFKWPSVVRLGKEAVRNIYNGDQDMDTSSQFDTSYSSPKRFLWDTDPYSSQWKYISEKDRFVGPAKTVDYEGIMQQFYNDGRFAPNPQDMGDKSSYSRSSLMTFCFIEILLQVRQQINSYEFRKNNGDEEKKRIIKRVILTCPTAMAREEQRTLRRAMDEASIVIRRFYNKTYNQPYIAANDREKIEIIPSVRDLSLKADNLDVRRSWNYDEATCCQMVYMYSELRRYLGNSKELFSIYGRRRNGELEPSLTIGTLDIGAGTTDIMICNYTRGAETINPTPLFWETFKIAGDDLVKRIIIDIILDSPQKDYPEASGIVTAKLKSLGVNNISDKMHHFFSDTHGMGNKEKKMRKEFMIQVLQPIANFLLDKLQKNEPEKPYTYNDIFLANEPSDTLMDFFEQQMGFRFEDLVIRYSPDFMNEIIRRVFEKSMRKWAALFYKYQCDVVLISGRPCSLKQVQSMLRRLSPTPPNRMVTMSNFRVGSWYPSSTDIGHFKDNKSMVAVGALIAYLAENGRFSQFRLNVENLIKKVLPTTEFIGVINAQTGTLDSILTPEVNGAYKEVAAFPISIGAKQFDVDGYPANLLYMLKFNEKEIRKSAMATVRKQAGLPEDAQESLIAPDKIANEMEIIKFRMRKNSPLRIRLEREYHEDKEYVKIDSIEDSERNELPVKYFELALQTWSEDSTNWLDTGVFKLHISI